MFEKKSYIRDGRAPIPAKELTSMVMSSIRYKNTNPELLLRKALWHNGIKGYRLHWKKAHGKPDISFPARKIAVFVNGCFWHRCPYCNPPMPKSHSNFWSNKFEKNVLRDKNKIELLNSEGWKTIVLWECQILTELIRCIGKVNDCIMNSPEK